MQALVTGGAGFIGSHVVDALLARGDSVCVIDDLSTGSLENLEGARRFGPRFEMIDNRVENVSSLRQLVADADLIFHFAAAVGVRLVVEEPVKTLETNLSATDCLLRAAVGARGAVFFASTSEVYGKSGKSSFSETDDIMLGPPSVLRWGYACSKAFDEFLALAYAKQYGIRIVVGRLFNTVGPRQTGKYGMVMPRMIRQALRNEAITVFGDGSQTRCFCHVEDSVHAILSLVQQRKALGQLVNIGSEAEISMAELAHLVKRQTSSSSEVVFVPYEEAMGAGFEDIQRRKPNLSKLEKTIGFKPDRRIEEIVSSVLEYTLRTT